MRVTSASWEGAKVFLRDQVLEVRNVDGRLHVVASPRHQRRGPSDTALRPYGPGESNDFDVISHA
jgi:hypothetical protein